MKQTIKDMVTIIGGNKALAMTGGSFSYSDEKETLYFTFKGSRKCKYLAMKYDSGSDLFNMTFSKQVKYELKTVKEFTRIYCDMVRGIFEETTGLYLSL